MSAQQETTATAIITLDELDPTPKYAQIVEQVKAHVTAGRLSAGATLPSVRQLAGDLGINVNTVVAAYRALEAENIILLRHGSRAVIHPRLSRQITPQSTDIVRLRRALASIQVEAVLAGVSRDQLRALADETWSTSDADRAATSADGPTTVGQDKPDREL